MWTLKRQYPRHVILIVSCRLFAKLLSFTIELSLHIRVIEISQRWDIITHNERIMNDLYRAELFNVNGITIGNYHELLLEALIQCDVTLICTSSVVIETWSLGLFLLEYLNDRNNLTIGYTKSFRARIWHDFHRSLIPYVGSKHMHLSCFREVRFFVDFFLICLILILIYFWLVESTCTWL